MLAMMLLPSHYHSETEPNRSSKTAPFVNLGVGGLITELKIIKTELTEILSSQPLHGGNFYSSKSAQNHHQKFQKSPCSQFLQDGFYTDTQHWCVLGPLDQLKSFIYVIHLGTHNIDLSWTSTQPNIWKTSNWPM
ncbi:hypothetical protein GOODEAATRI_029460 [Goodea atripinnis]|uniref:Uncharacterized protein n=1 Tax=Goodea atripinnis TaxID=208336 RepID=A0ABV0NEN6_9TELE